MVTSCASFNCTNRCQKGSGISFHKFPLHKPELLSKWLVAIKRDKFVPTYSHRLCSIHFTEACFMKSEGNKILKDDAVPTLFDFPDHLRQNKELTFRGHGGSVDQLCWHAFNTDLLSTASGDKSVRIWDTRSQKCAATILTKGENINIAWTPDGNTIAVGNKEDLVTFIDTRTHKIKAEEQFNFEVNEIAWNKQSNLFFLTNGQGCIHILSYPDLELQHILKAHPGTCICIELDPTGRYFATGSADALVSLWDVDELACLRTFSRLDWPVRTISFSYDGRLLASASEDLVIDVGEVETGEKVVDIPVEAATFTVAWHPSQYLLAFACDDKDTYDRKRDAGTLKVYGFPSD